MISAAIVIKLLGAENKYINLFIMVPILLLVGEITPKTLALRNNVAFASFQSRPIQLFAKVITPLRWIVRLIADWITTLIIGKERTRGSIVTQDMMRTLAHEAEVEGVLTHHEARFIDHIFDFGKKSVAEIMTPRSAIFFLSAELPLTEIVSELNRARHAKVPIYKEHRDNVIGILYTRDLLKIDLQAAVNEGRSVTEFLREPFLVSETKPAEEMFETFRDRNLSVALTVDEFGGITGLITMTALLEHIFGHIRTLSEAARMQGIEQVDQGRYALEGDITFAEFNQEMKTSLRAPHAHTIAGYLLEKSLEVPPEGSIIESHGISYTIKRRTDRLIEEVSISW